MVATLRAWIEERTPHNRALGIRLVAAEPGEVTCRLPASEASEDTGALQRGALMALVDVACGGAVCMGAGRMERIATLDLRLDCVRPARPGGALTARAHCQKITGSLAFVRAIAHDGHPDDPVALVQATFMLGER